jgi:hypothetical protein
MGMESNLTGVAVEMRALIETGVVVSEVAKRFGIGTVRVGQLLEPNKTYARRAVAHAVKTGKLIPAPSCIPCGRSDVEVVAHHHDYRRPLAVLWLCRACHRRLHAGARIPAWRLIAGRHRRDAHARSLEWLCACTACRHIRPKHQG